MSKRQRREHEAEQAERNGKRRMRLIAAGSVVVLLVAAGTAALLIQSPWIAAHRLQIVGVLGLALFAVLLALPVVVEYERHPRHLSGPGKNPEQGPGPWKLGK